MENYYSNKVAVVTGAASGLGLGFAERLLAEGVRALWMADFNSALLRDESRRLSGRYPGRVFSAVVDCSKRSDVESLIGEAAARCGELDFLFNNAGRPMTRPSERIEIEEFEKLVQLNYMGVVYGTLAALKIMLRQQHGHIINTASCGGLLPVPFQAAYGSTKAAVIEFTRCLALEYFDRDIHFSQISPTNVATNIFSAEQEDEMRKQGKSDSEIAAATARIRPPENSMPLRDAVDYTFRKIAEKEVDIVFGEDGRALYRLFCRNPRKFNEEYARETALKRRAFYDAYYRGDPDAVFPG